MSLHTVLAFIAKNFHVICRGVVLEHRDAYISVEVNIDGRVCVLPASLMLSSTEISYAPCVGSKVLVAFVDKKLEHPIILGGIAEFDKDKISINDNIVVNKDSGKVAIKNDNASIKAILKEIVDLIKDIKIVGSYSGTIAGTASATPPNAVSGTSSGNITGYMNSSYMSQINRCSSNIEKLFE